MTQEMFIIFPAPRAELSKPACLYFPAKTSLGNYSVYIEHFLPAHRSLGTNRFITSDSRLDSLGLAANSKDPKQLFCLSLFLR